MFTAGERCYLPADHVCLIFSAIIHAVWALKSEISKALVTLLSPVDYTSPDLLAEMRESGTGGKPAS